MIKSYHAPAYGSLVTRQSFEQPTRPVAPPGARRHLQCAGQPHPGGQIRRWSCQQPDTI